MIENDRCAFCSLPLGGGARAKGRDGTEGEARGEDAYCCYGCRLAARVAESRGADEGTSWILVRLGTAVFLSMNVMMMALILYSKDVFASAGGGGDLSSAFYSLLRFGSMLLAAPVLGILGIPILENALSEIRRRRVSTDLVFVVGVTAAFCYSVGATLRGDGVVYFETACMLLIVVTLGRWLEAASKHKTTRAVTALRRLLPDEVTVIRDGRLVVVVAAELVVADRVLVRAGESVPVDGVIEEHGGHFDERALTGESVAVAKVVGDQVFGGTTSLDGSVVVRASAVGVDAAMGRLVALVEKARNEKGRFERLSERLAAVFVPVVFVAAGVGAWLGYGRGGFESGLMTMLAVVLISCPCALGLSTPMAVWSAMGTAARNGVLFRNSEFLERLCRVETLLFDKTGTLTTGEGRVTEFSEGEAITRSEVDGCLAAAAGLALRSNHPVSRAVARYTAERGIEAAAVEEVTTVAGKGVRGRLACTGEVVWLGNVGMAEEARHEGGEGKLKAGSRKPKERGTEGGSVTHLGVADRVCGAFVVGEELRGGVCGTVEGLKARGLDMRILSGDLSERVVQLGERLGIVGEGELSPGAKLERMAGLRTRGVVAMVGDGLNDAPALAGADVGVAMGCGTDVARESADVCLTNDNLERLGWAIDLSRATVRTIKQNLFWALAYNAVGVGLAMTGRLHPIAAALAMVASSLIVVTNSLRLGRDGEARRHGGTNVRREGGGRTGEKLAATGAGGVVV